MRPLAPLLPLALGLLASFLPSPAGPGQARAEDARPAALLAALVDLPTRAERAKRAAELARHKDVSLEAWLEAARSFGHFRRQPVGARTDQERLIVSGRPLLTPITVYVPQTYDPAKPAPLLLALHGSGGGAERMHAAWRLTADALGMVVVAPTDKRGIGGWTMSAGERNAAWAALRWARRTFNVDETRIYATGISRGGHLLWDMALRQPDRFAAIAPMIGGPLVSPARGRNNIRYAENLVDVPIRDLQGSRDDPGLLGNLRLLFQRLESLHAKHARLIEFEDLGHGFRMEAVGWEVFLGKQRRKPVPERVIRRAAHPGEGRSAWIEILETKPPTKEIFAIRVKPAHWKQFSRAKQREIVVMEAERFTARVEAHMLARGRFRVRTRGVKKLRLLLTASMFDPAEAVEITVGSKTRKRRVRPDARVLLAEFAERFDRTFLPIAEIVLRP